MLFETRDVLEHISCASICLRALRYVILIEVTHCLLSLLFVPSAKCLPSHFGVTAGDPLSSMAVNVPRSRRNRSVPVDGKGGNLQSTMLLLVIRTLREGWSVE